jgi:hypothetical protein
LDTRLFGVFKTGRNEKKRIFSHGIHHVELQSDGTLQGNLVRV